MPPWSEKEFAANKSAVDACVDDWITDNCGSFESFDDDPSLWSDMPVIDSKLAVGVLVALEKVVGRQLDVNLIEAGGYSSPDDLKARLLPRVGQVCAGTWTGKKSKSTASPAPARAPS
jgi:hypothetical protein